MLAFLIIIWICKMPLINCAKITTGSAGSQYDVTANLYPNCPAGYVITTSSYVLSLETQISQMQQTVADSQAATLLSNSQLASCNTLLSGAGSCPANSSANYLVADLLLGTNDYTLGDMAYVLVLTWGLGRILLYIRQFSS
jgi:hypothetical protein